MGIKNTINIDNFNQTTYMQKIYYKDVILKKIIIVYLFLLFFFAQQVLSESHNSRVILETSLGSITIELNHQAAPETTKNFLNYVEKGFYNNTIFHRVIKGFMIQGGGLTKDMQNKATDPPIRNEADNGLKNRRGTIAMARTNNPHSATSQFFINTVDNHFLDYTGKNSRGWGYCVFGKVVNGMNVVKSIERKPTTVTNLYRDVPVSDVIIKKIYYRNEKTK